MMNETAQNIWNIILPYEAIIRGLEEIIKQKDLEIIFLKKIKNNIPNINNMNIDPMYESIQFNCREIWIYKLRMKENYFV